MPNPIEAVQRTHVMVTWRSNGGLQTCGPMTVSEGTTMVLQQLRPEGYRDAAARMLTLAEAGTLYIKLEAEHRRSVRAARKAAIKELVA